MKCKYDTVLFDLDGTLSRSHEGVKASLIYALNQTGKPVPAEIEDTSRYIGPPLMDTLRGMCGFTQDEADKAAELYKYIYQKENKFKNYCYDGIPELLSELKRSGVKLGVATTKYEPSAEEVLKILGINDLFDTISGTTSDGTIKEKSQTIECALKRMNCTADDKTVLIGDSMFDTLGAMEKGIDFIGVLYGYGKREDMEKFGGKVFAETAEELKAFLSE